jgi:hypothetical protein
MRRLALFAAALLMPLALHAQDGTTALGASGEIYRVESGTYKALFPATAPAASANTPVLALYVSRAGTGFLAEAAGAVAGKSAL